MVLQKETTSVSLETKTEIQRIVDLEVEKIRQLISTHEHKTDELEAKIQQLSLIGSHNIDNADDVEKDSDTSLNDDADDDEEEKRVLFKNSTHRYLFMDVITRSDGTGYKVGRSHKCLAISVIVFQFCAIYVLALLAFHEEEVVRDRSTSLLLEIDSKYCYRTDVYKGYSSYDVFRWGNSYSDLAEAFSYNGIFDNMIPDLMRCRDPTDSFNRPDERRLFIGFSITAFLLLISYLASDVYDLFFLFRRNDWKAKSVSLVVLLKAGFAYTVGFFAKDVAENVRMLDGLMLFIGLIVVHKVDVQFS